MPPLLAGPGSQQGTLFCFSSNLVSSFFNLHFILFHTQAASTTVIKKHTRTHALAMAIPMTEMEPEARIRIHTSLLHGAID